MSRLVELLSQWKCGCTDGFYLQRSRQTPNSRVGIWIPCRRCDGTGLDPRASEAISILKGDPTYEPV